MAIPIIPSFRRSKTPEIKNTTAPEILILALIYISRWPSKEERKQDEMPEKKNEITTKGRSLNAIFIKAPSTVWGIMMLNAVYEIIHKTAVRTKVEIKVVLIRLCIFRSSAVSVYFGM